MFQRGSGGRRADPPPAEHIPSDINPSQPGAQCSRTECTRCVAPRFVSIVRNFIRPFSDPCAGPAKQAISLNARAPEGEA